MPVGILFDVLTATHVSAKVTPATVSIVVRVRTNDCCATCDWTHRPFDALWAFWPSTDARGHFVVFAVVVPPTPTVQTHAVRTNFHPLLGLG